MNRKILKENLELIWHLWQIIRHHSLSCMWIKVIGEFFDLHSARETGGLEITVLMWPYLHCYKCAEFTVKHKIRTISGFMVMHRILCNNILIRITLWLSIMHSVWNKTFLPTRQLLHVVMSISQHCRLSLGLVYHIYG